MYNKNAIIVKIKKTSFYTHYIIPQTKRYCKNFFVKNKGNFLAQNQDKKDKKRRRNRSKTNFFLYNKYNIKKRD